jgi:hypothetical protein
VAREALGQWMESVVVAAWWPTEEVSGGADRNQAKSWVCWAHWSEKETGPAVNKIKENENKMCGLHGVVGRKQFWAGKRKWKWFWNILAVDLNLKPRFKSKSNTFSNSNKFKPLLKIEIWDFWIKIILKHNLKFKSSWFYK